MTLHPLAPQVRQPEMVSRRLASVFAAAVAVSVTLTGGVSSAAAAVAPLPVNAGASYQLGGAYTPELGAGVVIRDRAARPAPGAYSICYLNGFQTQPDQTGWWKQKHRGLLLRKAGRFVIDGQWNEVLLDTSTPTKRRGIAKVVGRWIDGCATKGFAAVEFDNLDSYTRSRGRLTKADSLAMAKLLVKRAHKRGLAAGQKNASELGIRGRTIAKFDFAIAEECERYRECDVFSSVYGAHFVEVEYTDYSRATFDRACQARGAQISVILRDRLLRTPAHPAYRYEAC